MSASITHGKQASGVGGSGDASAPAHPAAQPPLVYTRKLNHPPMLDPSTGAVILTDGDTGEQVGRVRDHRTARAERFQLQATARRLLPHDHRSSKCHRWRAPNMEIQVLRGRDTGRAFFQGLQVCAMPWTCPVCAAKISERRRLEVAGGIAIAKASGLQVFLLTLTLRHGIGDDPGELVDKLLKAWGKLWQGKAGRALHLECGIVGTIRAIEVTHGRSGWHPHIHALLFVDPAHKFVCEGFSKIAPRWIRVCQSSGLPAPDLEHGCKIHDGTHAGRYVAKSSWGLESEVTKAHAKGGRNGNRTPYDLLRDYSEGDKQAGALWLAYVAAFQGRRQLYWSNGLKRRLAVLDVTDTEIVQAPDDLVSILLAQITDDQWRAIRKGGFQSAVLDLAESDPDALRAFLVSLGGGHDAG